MDKQSNNLITDIPPYCVGMRGENFHFDGACERVLQCLGETEYNHWLIAGVTGDAFTQVYPKNRVFYSNRYCVSDYHILYDADCTSYFQRIFDDFGYEMTYVSQKTLAENKEINQQKLIDNIDKGVPVIAFKEDFHLIVGYEENGNILLCQPHEEPISICREPFDDNYCNNMKCWIFVGEKKTQKDLGQMYRKAVGKMAEIMTTETKDYAFGAGAFRRWAKDIEDGYYEQLTPETADLWGTHQSFVACFETIAARCHVFLSKALELNLDLSFIKEIIPIFCREGTYDIGGLEELGGGFNVTLEALQEKDKRNAIAHRLGLFSENMDKIVGILKKSTDKI